MQQQQNTRQTEYRVQLQQLLSISFNSTENQLTMSLAAFKYHHSRRVRVRWVRAMSSARSRLDRVELRFALPTTTRRRSFRRKVPRRRSMGRLCWLTTIDEFDGEGHNCKFIVSGNFLTWRLAANFSTLTFFVTDRISQRYVNAAYLTLIQQQEQQHSMSTLHWILTRVSWASAEKWMKNKQHFICSFLTATLPCRTSIGRSRSAETSSFTWRWSDKNCHPRLWLGTTLRNET